MSQYQKSEFAADRRYNDFFWLYDKLKETFKGYIIPPLPEKTIIQSAFSLPRQCYSLLPVIIPHAPYRSVSVENLSPIRALNEAQYSHNCSMF